MSPGIRVFLVSGAFVLLACHGPEARAESGVKVTSPSNGANLTGATTTSVSANIAMPDGKTASAIRVRVYASTNGYIELFSSTFPPLPAGQTAFNANISLPTFNWYGEQEGTVMVEVVGTDAEVISGMQNSKDVNLWGNLAPPDTAE